MILNRNLPHKRRSVLYVLVSLVFLAGLLSLYLALKSDNPISSQKANKRSGSLQDLTKLKDGSDSPACKELNKDVIKEVFVKDLTFQQGLSNLESEQQKTSSCIITPKDGSSSAMMLTVLLREYSDKSKADTTFESVKKNTNQPAKLQLGEEVKYVFNSSSNQVTFLLNSRVYTLTLSNSSDSVAQLSTLFKALK